jgi:hypothetical protein
MQERGLIHLEVARQIWARLKAGNSSDGARLGSSGKEAFLDGQEISAAHPPALSLFSRVRWEMAGRWPWLAVQGGFPESCAHLIQIRQRDHECV